MAKRDSSILRLEEQKAKAAKRKANIPYTRKLEHDARDGQRAHSSNTGGRILAQART
jgi:hypothetical protein